MQLSGSRACPDPECGGTGEPETDGDITYNACTTCGYTFDYQRRSTGTQPTCAAGIPVDQLPQATPARTLPILTIGRPHGFAA